MSFQLHPLYYSSNCTGYRSNGEHGSNQLPWPTRHCTQIDHITWLNSCNVAKQLGFCDHPLLFSYLFRDIIYHSAPELCASQPQQFGTHSPIVLGRVIHSPSSATISKRITSAQPSLTPRDHPSSTRPDSFFRLWRFINFILTYLLICFLLTFYTGV